MKQCQNVIWIGEHEWQCDKIEKHDGWHQCADSDAYGDGALEYALCWKTKRPRKRRKK